MKNRKDNKVQKDTRQDIRKIRILIAILIPAVIATIGGCVFAMHKNINETATSIDDKKNIDGLHNNKDVEDSIENQEVTEESSVDDPKEDEVNAVLSETLDAGEEYVKETLFLGDSNTVRMMDFGFTSDDKTLAVLGMGIQSVKTLKCVEISEGTKDRTVNGVNWNSDENYDGNLVTMIDAVEILQPERIIITFGTNNANGMTTKEFIDEYVDVLEAIKSVSSQTTVLINSIPPIRENNSYAGLSQAKIDRFNKALVVMAEKYGYKFIDCESVLKDESTGYAKNEYLVEDGVHYSKTGLNVMFKYIRTHSYGD